MPKRAERPRMTRAEYKRVVKALNSVTEEIERARMVPLSKGMRPDITAFSRRTLEVAIGRMESMIADVGVSTIEQAVDWARAHNWRGSGLLGALDRFQNAQTLTTAISPEAMSQLNSSAQLAGLRTAVLPEEQRVAERQGAAEVLSAADRVEMERLSPQQVHGSHLGISGQAGTSGVLIDPDGHTGPRDQAFRTLSTLARRADRYMFEQGGQRSNDVEPSSKMLPDFVDTLNDLVKIYDRTSRGTTVLDEIRDLVRHAEQTPLDPTSKLVLEQASRVGQFLEVATDNLTDMPRFHDLSLAVTGRDRLEELLEERTLAAVGESDVEPLSHSSQQVHNGATEPESTTAGTTAGTTAVESTTAGTTAEASIQRPRRPGPRPALHLAPTTSGSAGQHDPHSSTAPSLLASAAGADERVLDSASDDLKHDQYIIDIGNTDVGTTDPTSIGPETQTAADAHIDGRDNGMYL